VGDSDRDAAKIFVGALSWDTSDDGLKDACIKHGEIVEARVRPRSPQSLPRGCAVRALRNAGTDVDDTRALVHPVIHRQKAGPPVGP